MRIAHFIDDISGSGGTERVASNLTKLFKDNDYFVPVIFTFQQIVRPFFDFPEDITIISLDKNDENLIDNINQKCVYYNIDVIIFHGYHSLFFNPNLDKLSDLCFPFILRTAFSSTNFIRTNPKRPIFLHVLYNIGKTINFHLILKEKYIEKLSMISYNEKIVVVSDICKRQLDSLLTTKNSFQNHTFCVHNPIMFSKGFKPKRENLILYVGRLREKKKNTMLIIKAWKRINKLCPNWKLLLIGEGELRDEINSFIEKNKLENVQLIPPQKNIEDFYLKSQIVVCTSNSDALPQVLVEGAFFSNALLTTSFDGGYAEVVKDGINGYIVPKNDLRQFSSRLLELIKDDVLRNQMMEKSNRFVTKFNPENVMNEWKTVFEGLPNVTREE